MSITTKMAGWLPVSLITDEDEFLCKWMFIGNARFTEPFFSDTLLRCKQLPENRHRFDSVSALPLLKEWISDKTPLQPTAFIFHVSRCGSTTLSQLLTLDPSNRVLSEVPLLDEILRIPYKTPGTDHESKVEEYFRAAMAWYGQPSDDREQHLFIKTDSWHLHFYQVLRKMFPKAPFIIITRSPAAILQSQRRQRGIQSIPGYLEPAVFGFDEKDISFDLDRHMEKVLETYFARILAICQADPHVTVVDYADGIENMLHITYQLSNVSMPSGLKEKIKERLRFDGKNPGFFFNPAITDTSVNVGSRCLELYHQCQSFRSTKIFADKTSQQ